MSFEALYLCEDFSNFKVTGSYMRIMKKKPVRVPYKKGCCYKQIYEHKSNHRRLRQLFMSTCMGIQVKIVWH